MKKVIVLFIFKAFLANTFLVGYDTSYEDGSFLQRIILSKGDRFEIIDLILSPNGNLVYASSKDLGEVEYLSALNYAYSENGNGTTLKEKMNGLEIVPEYVVHINNLLSSYSGLIQRSPEKRLFAFSDVDIANLMNAYEKTADSFLKKNDEHAAIYNLNRLAEFSDEEFDAIYIKVINEIRYSIKFAANKGIIMSKEIFLEGNGEFVASLHNFRITERVIEEYGLKHIN